MNPELREAIDKLAMHDNIVHSVMCLGRHEHLSEVDTLAHMVLHLAKAKDAMQAELLKRLMMTPPSITIHVGHCSEGDHCACGGDLPKIREGCGNWVKGGAA